ncbi:hypothetical protein AX17_007021 [Amanita inopinata Kibby_2008]|nr:hypothetical protein AX17_007021 [Amanita inopinata Kibby_2008]
MILRAKLVLLAASTFVGARSLPSSQSSIPVISDPASYVNLFIGTTNGGHVFPGATLPHGMAKVGMDTDAPENHAGYDADPKFNVTGFSQLHDSGTGGATPLSNFKIFPLQQCSSFDKCPTSMDSRKILRKLLPNGSPDDSASPGYFSTNLTNDIRVELTATRRTALHRYTFPEGTAQPRIIVDITNDGLLSSLDPVMSFDPSTAQVKGGATFSASFGPGTYKLYTCVTFKGDGYDLGSPTEYGIWLGDFPVEGATDIREVYYGKFHGFQTQTSKGSSDQLGALFTFKPAPGGGKTSIYVRAGVSYISSDQACANAEKEIPDYDFDGVHRDSRAQWNDVLGRIQVDTTDVPREAVELFYSSFYRTHISPADYTGENPKWVSSEPFYDSFYCNWDTYRTLYPLMSLHDPVRFAEIVRAMINIQQHEGWLPECHGATALQFVQGGSHGDPIVAEFFVKYAEHAAALGVSADDLYNALLADAEIQPPDWNLQGRQADIWKQLGYIPDDTFSPGGSNTKQASRTLEYAFDDFTISQVAKVLGKEDDAKKYLQRAGNFINVWNPNVSLPGYPNITGMMQLRFANGTFNYTDPRHCSIYQPSNGCHLNAAYKDGFYEASPMVVRHSIIFCTRLMRDLYGPG